MVTLPRSPRVLALLLAATAVADDTGEFATADGPLDPVSADLILDLHAPPDRSDEIVGVDGSDVMNGHTVSVQPTPLAQVAAVDTYPVANTGLATSPRPFFQFHGSSRSTVVSS